MNVLFFVAGYFPKPSANGLCVDAVIQKLKEKGDKVFCVSYRFPSYKKEETTDGVKIFRIKIQKHKYFLHKSFNAHTSLGKLFYKAVSFFFLLMRSVFIKPDLPIMDKCISNRFYSKAVKLTEEQCIDAVVGVNMPPEAVDATYRLKTKYPKIWSVAYLLDPIAGGLSHRSFDKATADKLCTDYEKKVLCALDSVIVQKEHQKHFEECFTQDELKNFSFLGVPLLKDNTSNKNSPQTDSFTAIYAGAVSKKFRDPTFIIEAFKKVSNGKLVMYLTGETSMAHKVAGEDPKIEIHGKIDRRQLEAVMQGADCFVNIGNSQTMQAPSKIIEYMSYGKPIISTYRIDNDTSAPYMEKYPASLCLDERSGDTSSAAKSIEEFMMAAPRAFVFSEIEKLFSDYTPDAFIRDAFR